MADKVGVTMHDCESAQEILVDLIFDDLDEGRRRHVLDQIAFCADCVEQYRSMADTLRVFDTTSALIIPGEEFWSGYEERLSKRMAAEIQLSLWQVSPSIHSDYRVTILEDSGIASRLVKELRAVAHDSQLTWPEFKRDPFGFTTRSLTAYSEVAWRFFSERNVALATLSSIFLVFFVVGGVYALDGYNRGYGLADDVLLSDEYEFAGWISNTNIPREPEKPEEGTPGLSRGKGAGSGEEKTAGGGGGGGNRSTLPTSVGKHARGFREEQIIPPSVRQPTIENPKLEMSATLKGDPLLIPEDTRPFPFGNPDSLSVIPSDGPGRNGGQGDGANGGQGAGDGKGYGPGNRENIGGGAPRYGRGGPGGPNGQVPPIDYGGVFKVQEVTRRAVIILKPDPPFTEEARRNGIMGVVRLRAILSANGSVTGISVIKGLPDGLTERAINAARSIKFQPAQKDGRTVSQYITLEYNFNIY